MQPAHLFSSSLLTKGVTPPPPFAPAEGTRPFPAWKRTIDIVGSLAALPLLAAATVAGSVVITLTSPGPLIFRQPAIGENGRRFGRYHFRTLHAATPPAADHSRPADRPPFLLGGAPLRRSGLHKLPQILNVLRGEMTLVGYQLPLADPAKDDRIGRPGMIECTVTVPGCLTPHVESAPRPTLSAEVRLITSRVIESAVALVSRGPVPIERN